MVSRRERERQARARARRERARKRKQWSPDQRNALAKRRGFESYYQMNKWLRKNRAAGGPQAMPSNLRGKKLDEALAIYRRAWNKPPKGLSEDEREAYRVMGRGEWYTLTGGMTSLGFLTHKAYANIISDLSSKLSGKTATQFHDWLDVMWSNAETEEDKSAAVQPPKTGNLDYARKKYANKRKST